MISGLREFLVQKSENFIRKVEALEERAKVFGITVRLAEDQIELSKDSRFLNRFSFSDDAQQFINGWASHEDFLSGETDSIDDLIKDLDSIDGFDKDLD